MPRPSPVVICDSHRLFRDALASLLRAGKFRIHGLHPDFEAVEAKGVSPPVDCVFIFGETAFSRFDLPRIARLKLARPGCRIILIASDCSDEQRWQAAHYGIDGVLLKSVSGEVLVRSLELVLLGERVFIVDGFIDEGASRLSFDDGQPSHANGAHRDPSPSLLAHQEVEVQGKSDETAQAPAALQTVSELAPPISGPLQAVSLRREGLSDREMQILDCLVSGHSNKLIARHCNITEATVKVHLKAILRKISVANRTQAAVWAMNRMRPTVAIAGEAAPPPPPSSEEIDDDETETSLTGMQGGRSDMTRLHPPPLANHHGLRNGMGIARKVHLI